MLVPVLLWATSSLPAYCKIACFKTSIDWTKSRDKEANLKMSFVFITMNATIYKQKDDSVDVKNLRL